MLKLDLDANSQVKSKKKQKLVKHKRKNWSKTDISEVEKGIDELRQEQRTGGVRSEKKDDELFYINKTKLNIIDDDSKPEAPIKKKKLTLQEKLDNLNCYRNLKPDPNSAPAHLVNKKKEPNLASKRQSKARKVDMNKPRLKRILKNVLSYQKEEAISNEKNGKNIEKKLDFTLQANFDKNLWTHSDLPELNETNEHYFRTKNLILPKKPKPIKKLQTKSEIPKIEIPHPGTSYNPDYDEHQELLLKAHLIEEKKLKEEQKQMRKLTTTVKKMSWDEIEKLWLEEMSCNNLFEADDKLGLNEDEIQDKESEKKSDEISISKRELRRRLKKTNLTKAKRKRKTLLDKIKERRKQNEKKLKIQQNEIYRLKSIKKELSEKEKELEEKQLKKELEEKHKELFSTKRLGRLKYEEPELDLKLSDEITGNLRTLKPEGNIMTDRYKNLQKRNIIEPRERARTQKHYSKKRFDKRNAYEKTYYIK